jgi:predicted nucleotide-binding protein
MSEWSDFLEPLSGTVRKKVETTVSKFGPVLTSGTFLCELVESGPREPEFTSRILASLQKAANWEKVRDNHLGGLDQNRQAVSPRASRDAKRAFEFALTIAKRAGHHHVHMRHIVAVLLTKDVEANRLLVKLGPIDPLVKQFFEDVITRYPQEGWQELIPSPRPRPAPRPRENRVVKRAQSKTIFIVHGHNKAMKYELGHSLQKAGLDVTILDEQTNEGRTLLEKFSDHAAEAGFAVVLLSADDVGRAKDATVDNFRARQNVVFELGFFCGKLGRDKVCAVRENGVEIPSDVHGFAYFDYDSAGSWKHRVAKEINRAGIKVDFDKL